MLRKSLTEEDIENIDLIVNPYPHVTESCLTAIESCNGEVSSLLEELDLILCNKAAVTNPAVQSKFPRVLALLKNSEHYEEALLVVADACRHVTEVQDAFRDLGVFELVKYDNVCSYPLIFSLCLNNARNCQVYFENYYSEERDSVNPLISELKIFYGTKNASLSFQ